LRQLARLFSVSLSFLVRLLLFPDAFRAEVSPRFIAPGKPMLYLPPSSRASKCWLGQLPLRSHIAFPSVRIRPWNSLGCRSRLGLGPPRHPIGTTKLLFSAGLEANRTRSELSGTALANGERRKGEASYAAREVDLLRQEAGRYLRRARSRI